MEAVSWMKSYEVAARLVVKNAVHVREGRGRTLRG